MNSICLRICTIGILIFVNPILSAENQNNQNDVHVESKRYDSLEWDILKILGSPDFGNVLISPFSIKLLLAMLYEGSSGTTKLELESILEYSPSDTETLKDKYKRILESLKTESSGSELEIGTRIFLDASVTPQQRFASIIETFYKSHISEVNFNDVISSRNEINYWASNVTRGKIRDLVSEGDLENAVVLMANAIFFKSLWKEPFLKKNTYDGVFYLTNQQKETVQYMHTVGEYYYSVSKELDAKILRLPFKAENINMFILLPNSKGGLNKLIRDLNPKDLRRYIWLMDTHEVKLHLPKFSFQFTSRLGRILQTLGVKRVFQNNAGLASIARGKGVMKKLMVTDVFQKAGIDVNEEGSTAYAATELVLTNKFGVNEVLFNASNPFVFYIEDEYTGTVLFAGKVENPVQKQQPPFREDLQTPSRFANTNTNTSTTEGMAKVTPSTGIR